MFFGEKLKKAMKKMEISQTELSAMTGIGKSSISQYLSGKNEPSKARRAEIALALGLQEDYFEIFEPVENIKNVGVVNVPVQIIACLMGKSKEFVVQGLKDGVFPWGYAVKMKHWSYFISSVKFTEYTGIEIPMKMLEEENAQAE